ncbi:MAG: SDR family NAD(P)-dependent oxidoreductase [Candidatus Levybacteria bacterium]|nr:SDR family NAD(P)-dependent oxidoreductase [Candidatus Levybacteria bacterium]
MSAEQAAQHDPNVLQSAERPLAGKTAIVTGGSRDIGAAIVKNLALNGANVVFVYKRDDESANEVLESVAKTPGQVHAIKADLEKPEDRQASVNQAIEILGGKVDFLVLSTSGRSRKINQEASNDLIDRTLDHMNEGGTVLRMTSAIAHFGRLFENDPSIPKVYHKPAEAKNEEEESLRGRIEELKARKIRLIMVAPPAVPSRNLDLVNELTSRATGGASNAEDFHNPISDNLGLPRIVSQNEVGEKIVELLSNPDIESGYTELFSGVLDIQTELGRMYGVSQVYVNTLQMLEVQDGQRRGIGREIASFNQVTRPGEPGMVDEIWIDEVGSYIGSVVVNPEHASGHFRTESGLPQILPGHKQIRAAAEAIGMIEGIQGKHGDKVRIVGFESAEFTSVIPADGTSLHIIPRLNADGTYDVEIVKQEDRKVAAHIRGLRMVPAAESTDRVLLEDQIIEGACQTVGVLGANNTQVGKMPLLLRIGRTEFTDGAIGAGQGVSYDTLVRKDGKRYIKGSVRVYSEGNNIASIDEIEAVLVGREVASRLSNPPAHLR